jgi:hypothetical protein
MTVMPPFKPQEPEPRKPWFTYGVVGLLVSGMITAVACHFLSSISAWPQLGGSAVEDYTKFRREVFDSGVVDTGLTFTSAGDPWPNRQFCYVRTGQVDSGLARHLTVAVQEGKGAIVYSDITEKDAAELGLSVDTIRRLARSHCRFMGGG